MKNRNIDELKKIWLKAFTDILTNLTLLDNVKLEKNDIKVEVYHNWVDLPITKNLYFQVDLERVFNDPYNLNFTDYIHVYSHNLKIYTTENKLDLIFETKAVKELRTFLIEQLTKFKIFVYNKVSSLSDEELKYEFINNIKLYFKNEIQEV